MRVCVCLMCQNGNTFPDKVHDRMWIWPPLRNALSDHVHIAQVPVEVLPEVQPELPQECRQSAGYAPLPGG